MRPGANQAFARTRQAGQEAKNGIGIAIGPPAYSIDWASDITIIFTDRAMLPEGIAALVAQPGFNKRWALFQPLQPEVAPMVTNKAGVWWPGVISEHG